MPPTRRHHSRHHLKPDQHQMNAQSSNINNVKRFVIEFLLKTFLI